MEHFPNLSDSFFINLGTFPQKTFRKERPFQKKYIGRWLNRPTVCLIQSTLIRFLLPVEAASNSSTLAKGSTYSTLPPCGKSVVLTLAKPRRE